MDILVMYVILYYFLKLTASNLVSDTLMIYDTLLRLMLNTVYHLLYKQESPFIQLLKMLLVYSVSDYFVSFAF